MNQSTHQNDTSKDPGITSYEMNLTINLAQRAFNDLLKTCLGHHGLTVPVWSVLGSLYKSGPARPTAIASALGIKPPYITVLIAKLEQEKLIEHQFTPDDERGKTISITQAGRKLVTHVETQLEDCLQEQFGQVDGNDLKTFFAMSSYIAHNVKHKS